MYTSVEKGNLAIMKLILSANPDLEIATKVKTKCIEFNMCFSLEDYFSYSEMKIAFIMYVGLGRKVYIFHYCNPILWGGSLIHCTLFW